jgi:hypothetical protein
MATKSSIVAFRSPSTAAEARVRDSRQQADGKGRTDFRDAESQSVLARAAVAVAHELGREAAREYFKHLVQLRRPS